MKWQPIETAPKDGTRVLVWHPEYSAPLTAQFYSDTWGIHSTLPRLFNQPTHWMLVPAPPKHSKNAIAENASRTT